MEFPANLNKPAHARIVTAMPVIVGKLVGISSESSCKVKHVQAAAIAKIK